jgi:benzoylformate decarboxylase/acetolactate synthase-1/2/3 large subunit
MGWYAEGPIDDPSQVRAAVERAKRVVLDEGRPALVDTLTQFR